MSARTRRNRRIMAARLGWPRGATEVCECLERAHPGWSVNWMRAWTVRGFEREAGFYAWRSKDRPLVKDGFGYAKRRELYGADADAIAAALDREV